MIHDTVSPYTIRKYARRLEGNTVNLAKVIHDPFGSDSEVSELSASCYATNGVKPFGEVLMNDFFNKHESDVSISSLDFPKAGLDLKLVRLREYSGRLMTMGSVLLGYMDNEVSSDFEVFSARKLPLMLIVFYQADNISDPHNYPVDLVDLWNCIDEDGPQIRKDWEILVGRNTPIDGWKPETVCLGKRSRSATPDSIYLKPQYVRRIYRTLVARREGRV